MSVQNGGSEKGLENRSCVNQASHQNRQLPSSLLHTVATHHSKARETSMVAVHAVIQYHCGRWQVKPEGIAVEIYLLCQKRFRKLFIATHNWSALALLSPGIIFEARLTCPLLRIVVEICVPTTPRSIRQYFSTWLGGTVIPTVHAVDHARLDRLSPVLVQIHHHTPGNRSVCCEPRLIRRFGFLRANLWCLCTWQERRDDSRRRIQHNLPIPFSSASFPQFVSERR